MKCALEVHGGNCNMESRGSLHDRGGTISLAIMKNAADTCSVVCSKATMHKLNTVSFVGVWSRSAGTWMRMRTSILPVWRGTRTKENKAEE